MRNIIFYVVLVCLGFTVSGCSVMHTYVIRNFSAATVEIEITLKGLEQRVGAKNPEITSADEIVPIKKSKITRSFIKRIAGTKTGEDTYVFLLPPGHSANISSLLISLSRQRTPQNSFQGAKLEIRAAKTILSFANNLSELHGVFKFKSFFASGPFVYYLDLK